MKKRIAFVISSQHFIPHGGIGQFGKGFAEMSEELGWVVDFIFDKPPQNNSFTEYVKGVSGKYYAPWDALSYGQHQKTFAFSDSYNLERTINFRDAMMVALQENLYDGIVINTPEAAVAIYGLGIQKYLPIIFYTHNENMVFKDTNSFKGVFNESFDEFFLNVVKCDGMFLGTQCSRNVEEMKGNGVTNAVELPMPLPERGLKTPWCGETSGVLFIGRWEDRKNPKEFLRVIEETNLPAKVMTNSRGAKKFKEALDKIGVEYDIREGITGQEKVDFIKSSRVFYMPSKSECYPFAFFETHGHVPSVVLEPYKWYTNFNQEKFHVVDKKDAASKVKELYETPSETDIEYINALDDRTKKHWVDFIEGFESKSSNSKSSTIASKDDLFYHEHIQSLGRFASIEDVISVLAKKQHFNPVYSKESTWLSSSGKEPAENAQESEEHFNLFG